MRERKFTSMFMQLAASCVIACSPGLATGVVDVISKLTESNTAYYSRPSSKRSTRNTYPYVFILF